jgi:hypothetical protein
MGHSDFPGHRGRHAPDLREIPACLHITSRHSDHADPAMTMAGRTTPVVPGFWSSSAFVAAARASSYPAPATFSASRADRFHGSSLFEAH